MEFSLAKHFVNNKLDKNESLSAPDKDGKFPEFKTGAVQVCFAWEDLKRGWFAHCTGGRSLNHRPMRDDAFSRDDDNPVADEIKFVVNVPRFAGGRNRHVVPDARVLVYDGVLDPAVGADANARLAGMLALIAGFRRFVIVGAEDDRAVQFRAGFDDGSQADDAVADARVVDDAAVGDDGVVNLRAVDFRAGQIARTAENRRVHVKEIEPGQFGDEVEVCLEE